MKVHLTFADLIKLVANTGKGVEIGGVTIILQALPMQAKMSINPLYDPPSGKIEFWIDEADTKLAHPKA
jgi:hypothetical protein